MYYETDFLETVFAYFKLKEKDYDRYDVIMCKQELARMLAVNEEEVTKVVENEDEEQYFDELDDAKEEAREKAYDDCKEEFSDAIKGYVDKMAKKAVENDSDEGITSFWATLREKLDEILDYADRHVNSY